MGSHAGGEHHRPFQLRARGGAASCQKRQSVDHQSVVDRGPPRLSVAHALRRPKWAVVGFTKSLSIELGALKIRVNAIQPGAVEGDRIRRGVNPKGQLRGVSMQTVQEEALSHASLKEMIAPQQLADMMVFLASPRGRAISGQAISICGDVQSLF